MVHKPVARCPAVLRLTGGSAGIAARCREIAGHARGSQPVAALRGRRSLRLRPAAAGGGDGQRRLGAGAQALVGLRPALGPRRDARAGRLANENPPRLQTPRRARARGSTWSSSIRPITPSWRESMTAGLHASTWRPDGTPRRRAAEVARAARYYMVAQVENGHMCPITMTRAVGRGARGRARRCCASAAAEDPPRTITTRRFRPWRDKTAITLGMGMTEKQGGTDVRANTTRAEPAATAYRDHRPQVVHVGADVRRLPGAGAGAGRADLLLHAALPARRQRQRRCISSGSRTSSATAPTPRRRSSSTMPTRGGSARKARGIRTIIEMVQLTRLDCAIASAGLMRDGAGAGAASRAPSHACSRRSSSTSR